MTRLMAEAVSPTFRLTLGVDPGQSGAIAAIADGEPAGFIDMPVLTRKAGGQIVDGARLAAELRALIQRHPGAHITAAVEQVSAMPGQGVSSMFRFGQADGIVRGVLGALGIGLVEVQPVTWKKRMRLIGADKDAARTQAIQRFPSLAAPLARKKDIGRADALLIALWACLTEQAPTPENPSCS
jgi:crossover junction endodeoxyribonuclease RuvC